MESRKFEALQEKIKQNQIAILKVRYLSFYQALNLHFLIKNNTSIVELIFLPSPTLSLVVFNIILGSFFRHTPLAKISISPNAFPSDGATMLSNFIRKTPAVTELDLSGCNLGDNNIKVIAKALRVNTTLKKVSLSYNGITRQSCWELKDVLLANKSLIELNLDGSSLSGEALSVLAEGLLGNQVLSHIGLRNCKLTASDMKIFSQVLRQNGALNTIGVAANNDIGDSGITSLSEALRDNGDISTIYISGTLMSNEGLVALVDKVKHAKKLQNFGCANNMIGDAGGHALADLIRASTSLKQLFAYGCGIGFNGAFDIARAMQVNQSITYLDL